MTLATVLVSLGTELAPLATVFPSPGTSGISLADWNQMVTDIKGGELFLYTPFSYLLALH
jgi:hypothetical protein